MMLNMRTQMFIIEKEELKGISKLTFAEIDFAIPSDFSAELSDYEANQVDPTWQYFIRMAVKGNPEKIIACASLEDRDKWIQSFNTIIKRKELGVDTEKIDLFTFDKFYKH